MGFKWKCPECEQVHEYGGNATTKATARCGSKNLKIWQYRILPPKPPKKPPQATKYETKIRNPPSSISAPFNVRGTIRGLRRARTSIGNKPEVKAKKEDSAYYSDYVEWGEIIENLKIFLLGDEN